MYVEKTHNGRFNIMQMSQETFNNILRALKGVAPLGKNNEHKLHSLRQAMNNEIHKSGGDLSAN